MISKLEPVTLDKLWKHEAYDFTKWLFENCDILSEQIGLTINPIEKEKSVGPFAVDILAEDAHGDVVVIENQLYKTDHDHLGKLLTYLSNLDAKVAIWISPDPRPEHVTAIDFLNEVVPADTRFYLLKLQAFRIGESDPAPLFTIEAGPSEERTAGGSIKVELAERDQKRYRFFEQLLEQVNKVTDTFSNISPVGYQCWINTSAGKTGLIWALVATKNFTRVELVFSHSDESINQTRYEKLFAKKKEIEDAFGESLDWDFKETRKQSYVRKIFKKGGLEDEEKWPEIQSQMVDCFVRLEKALSPHLQNL